MTNDVGRYQVGFTSQHHVKHGDKFDGALAQVMEEHSDDDISNEKRQNVYKNFGFAKASLVSEVGNAKKDSELKCNK